MNRFSRAIVLCVLLTALLAAAFGSVAAQGSDPRGEVQLLVPEVIATYPHDTGVYTQGLLLYEGSLFESTGRHTLSSTLQEANPGTVETLPSTLREVNPKTGEVLRSITLSEDYFGEGLERVDDKLIQITWHEGVALVYDLETFEQTGSFDYQGEGWGLCSDGRYLYMSDGSPFLSLRDRDTFELIFKGMVTLQGAPVNNINELECVGDYIYANVWHTDYILKIDKINGVVVAVVDTFGLMTPDERAALADDQAVLNGIAYDAEADTFLITGKMWPTMFEVRFVPAEQ